ncbi:hypothetical protein CBO05C_2267 [Clostridium botulinum B str. Osaka05]|uniref:Uncharacterized protein n=1 Tax=Clostridium botulinum B str. Osaka05 TaxID=1407017 RepID=A0A0S6U3S3_CLOBO|nr:hypothetical protein [Clostridium botulinum]GAE02577.1 hypothetical protein CBO05C_2267 [Clostridium botulinum B str. Osaka05]
MGLSILHNYVRNSHPAIVSTKVFDKVQESLIPENIMENIFWEMVSCRLHIGDERKEVKWFGDV